MKRSAITPLRLTKPIATLMVAYWLARIGREHLWPSWSLFHDDVPLFMLIATYWAATSVLFIMGGATLTTLISHLFSGSEDEESSSTQDDEVTIYYSNIRALKVGLLMMLVWGVIALTRSEPTYWLLILMFVLFLIKTAHYIKLNAKNGLLTSYTAGLVTVSLPLAMVKTVKENSRRVVVETKDGARYRFWMDKYSGTDRKLLKSFLLKHDVAARQQEPPLPKSRDATL